MHQIPHIEKHFTASEVVRDIVIGMSEEAIQPVVAAIRGDRKRWVDFMMKFELGLEEPDPRRANRSALTIAGSYIAGGMIPLCPYFFIGQIHGALWASVAVTLAALLAFGYIKGRYTGNRPFRSDWQTATIGALAAAAAFSLAKLFS